MISFELTDDQIQSRDMLLQFAKEEIAPRARDADETRQMPEDLLQAIWDLGVVSLAIPETYGGSGASRSAVTNALMFEALGYGCAGLASAALSSTMFVNPLIDLGTEEQKQALLPQFCGREPRIATLALHESAMTFDPARMSTRAEQRGGDWVITGTKRLVTMGMRADHILVLARSAPGTDLSGIDAFLVPTATPGLKVTPESGMMGLTCAHFARLDFDEVILPSAARLGGEAGTDVRRILAMLRTGGAALSVGLSRAVTDFAIPYAKERVAFGEPIAKKQAIAFMLAEMHVECDAMRWMAWKAAAELDAGEQAHKTAILTQDYANRHALKVADDGLQIFGGHGYIRDLPLEMWLRNARSLTLHEALVAA